MAAFVIIWIERNPQVLRARDVARIRSVVVLGAVVDAGGVVMVTADHIISHLLLQVPDSLEIGIPHGGRVLSGRSDAAVSIIHVKGRIGGLGKVVDPHPKLKGNPKRTSILFHPKPKKPPYRWL